MKKYTRLMDKLYNTPWLVKADTLDNFSRQFIQHLKGELPMPMAEDEDEDKDDMPMNENGIAIISIDGVIGKRLSMLESMCGGVDVDMIKDQIEVALEDPLVKAIVFDINSPGGTVTGVPELAAYIKEANKQKKCFAYVDCVCASAAYYLASQCEAIFTTQTAELGSVGVYMLTLDESRALENEGIKVNAITNDEATLKLAGASFKPMTDDEKSYFKSGVQKTFNQFKSAVKSNRNIRDEYLNGAVFDGEDAVNFNFADGLVTDLQEVLTLIDNEILTQ